MNDGDICWPILSIVFESRAKSHETIMFNNQDFMCTNIFMGFYFKELNYVTLCNNVIVPYKIGSSQKHPAYCA